MTRSTDTDETDESKMDDKMLSGDMCRVCRSEGTSDKPLFHPCVCTGSIKFIHQDCLVQWLKYSKKEYCELCKHRYTFTPIYAPDMPKRLPIKDIVMGLVRGIARAVKYWLHYTLVAIAWLGVVPLTACRIYRCLFAGSVNSLLTLPLDMLSTENLVTDCFQGCFVVTCTLCTFISLVWLREQILHGGGPDWLDPDPPQPANQRQHPPAAAPIVIPPVPVVIHAGEPAAVVNALLPGEVPNAAEPEAHGGRIGPENMLGQGFANDVVPGGENGAVHDAAAADGAEPPVATGAALDNAAVNGGERDIGANVVDPGDDLHPGQDGEAAGAEGDDDEDGDDGDEDDDGVNGLGEAAQDENNWNAIEWDRAAEELTWERLLGLDGSLLFLEHVFWVISLNTLFIVIFAFCPYHIGHFTISTAHKTDLTMSGTPFDGILTTLVGYVVIAVALVTLHWFGSLIRMKKFRRLLGLCYVTIKVVLLVVMEIGVFPLTCGWWLDICSLSMFDASIKDREHSFRMAPGTSMFIHWLVGMVYIFYFASFILLLREVLRPGLLWFLRNFNDPNFNPIQEMIHLPVYRHIRRFLISMVVFGTIVLIMLWFPIQLIRKLFPTFLPFHVMLSSDTPVSELSLELLLLQVVLPALLEQGHTRHWLKGLIRGWCLLVSWLLDLRSYLLGDDDIPMQPKNNNFNAPAENVDAQNVNAAAAEPVVGEQQQPQPAFNNDLQQDLLPNNTENLPELVINDGVGSIEVDQVDSVGNFQEATTVIADDSSTKEESTAIIKELVYAEDGTECAIVTNDHLHGIKCNCDITPSQQVRDSVINSGITKFEDFLVTDNIVKLNFVGAAAAAPCIDDLSEHDAADWCSDHSDDRGSIRTVLATSIDNPHTDSNMTLSAEFPYNISSAPIVLQECSSVFSNRMQEDEADAAAEVGPVGDDNLLAIIIDDAQGHPIIEIFQPAEDPAPAPLPEQPALPPAAILQGIGVANQALLQAGVPIGFQPYGAPNMFTLRLICLLGLMCLTLFLASLISFILPVFVGRRLMSIWTGDMKVHELYTAACGLYTCWIVLRVFMVLYTWIPQGWTAVMDKILEWVVLVSKSVFIATVLIGVVPLMLGLIFELVIVVPIRVPLEQTPVFFPWQDWALGVLHAKIITAATMMGPQWRLKRVIEQVYNQGLRQMDLIYIVKELCLPVLVSLGMLLAIPTIISRSIAPVFVKDFETQNLIERRIYPVLLGIVLFVAFCLFQARQFRRLYEHIKNDK